MNRAQYRVSSADRDHATDMLSKAFADGRLTRDEYDTRTERALTARTYADLDALVIDLPEAHPAPVRVPQTNSLAVASLLCGIGEFLTFGLTALPAVVLGHMARHQIHRTGERGSGLALAGLLLGWVAVALFVLAVVAGLGAAAIAVHQGSPVG